MIPLVKKQFVMLLVNPAQRIFYLFLTCILIFTGCDNSTVHEITVEDLSKEMKTNSSLIILDVRTTEELIGPLGKIASSINIPIEELEGRINELSKYKTNEIAVICRTGVRSARGTKILIKNGFHAVNIKGGMAEFRKKINDQ